MKNRFLSLVATLALGVSVATAYDMPIQTGWQLEGALNDINVSDLNNQNIISVWTYNTGDNSWNVYLPNNPGLMENLPTGVNALTHIDKGQGFWINASGMTNISLADAVDDISNNDESDDNDYNQSDDYNNYGLNLIDPVQDLTLDDIANKTFTIGSSDEDDTFNITFDENGSANFVVPSYGDKEWSAKLEDGVLNIYVADDTIPFIRFKKVTSGNDGLIVAGFDNFSSDKPDFLDGWLLSENPQNMEDLLPYKKFDSYDATEYEEYTTDLELKRYHYDSENNSYVEEDWTEPFTIEDGYIVTSYEDENGWTDENNNTHKYSDKSKFKVIATIGRYNVITKTYTSNSVIISEDYKGKSWSDFIDSDMIINEDQYKLKSDGTVDNMYESDENITYSIDGNTLTLDFSYCNNGTCMYERSETYILNPDEGSITETYTDTHSEVVSSAPIVEPMDGNYRTNKRKLNNVSIKKSLKNRIKVRKGF